MVEVLFGLLSILAVFLFPEQTDINFAWPVKPAVMAATLGAFYLAAAPSSSPPSSCPPGSACA